MMDWQMILLQLRKHYKPVRRIAFEIGANPSALQKVARYGVKTDLSYGIGSKLVALHSRYVKVNN
jgi:hypothetical protein